MTKALLALLMIASVSASFADDVNPTTDKKTDDAAQSTQQGNNNNPQN